MYLKNITQNIGDPMIGRFTQERVLRSAALLNVLGISGPTLWRRVKDKSFPQPISLGGRSVGWLQSEVHAWIKARAGVRDQSHVAKGEGVQS